VQVDERHRPGEARDDIRDAVLHVTRLLLGVLEQRRVDRLRQLRRDREAAQGVAVGCRRGGGCLVHIRHI
jgi:hypothetical protein